MHDLHLLPDDVLANVEKYTRYLHRVHDMFGAIDLETHVKNSTLMADACAAMEHRGIPVPAYPDDQEKPALEGGAT